MLVPAARAKAACVSIACSNQDWLVPVGAAALVAPSDVGVLASAPDPSTARLVIGWSWQIPILIHDEARNRLVPSFDLLPRSDPSWRVRFGYRYSCRHLFAGAGLGASGSQVSIAPELGARFANSGHHDEAGPSLHMITRAEIDPSSGNLRGVAVLLGWNLI